MACRVFSAAERVNGLLHTRPLRTLAKGVCICLGLFAANVGFIDHWLATVAALLVVTTTIVL